MSYDGVNREEGQPPYDGDTALPEASQPRLTRGFMAAIGGNSEATVPVVPVVHEGTSEERFPGAFSPRPVPHNKPTAEAPAPAAKPNYLLRAAAGVALAAVVGGGIYAGVTSGSRESAGAPAAASTGLPADFACDVTAIGETPNNEGLVVLSEPAPANHHIYIGNVVRSAVGVPSAADPKTINFITYGLHTGTIGVSIDEVACRGTFDLGRPGNGDEHFVTG